MYIYEFSQVLTQIIVIKVYAIESVSESSPIVTEVLTHLSSCIYTESFYRVVKCDVTKIKICELMRFVEIIREIKTKNVSLLKISMLVQTVGQILSANALMTPYKSF